MMAPNVSPPVLTLIGDTCQRICWINFNRSAPELLKPHTHAAITWGHQPHTPSQQQRHAAIIPLTDEMNCHTRLRHYIVFIVDYVHNHIRSQILLFLNKYLSVNYKYIDEVEMVAAISQIFKNFALNTEAKVVFEEMNTKLIDITQSEYGFIGEVFNDGTQDFLKTHAITNIAWNKETRDFYETNAPEGLEFKNLKSLFGHVITTGKPVISNNPYEDDRRGGLPEGHPHMGSFLGLPILLQGKFIGMVGMANRPGGYNETLCQELKPYLSACASLIEGYKLVKQKAEARKDLETSVLKLKNQNEKLSEFTYIVSHDVRKHASNLKMLVEMHDASNKSEVMQMIASTTNHLFTTVDYISEIIEVTQKPSLRRREINLSELATDIFSSFEIELKEFSVQLNIEEAITIVAEPAYLNSIFENLLSNAIKYCRHDSKTIEVSAVIQNQTALITFKDYGRGIDMARHGEELFQMFSTFHGSSDSKGLGLYLVKKYIDSMKGKISVDSSISLNSYTIFNIEIPI